MLLVIATAAQSTGKEAATEGKQSRLLLLQASCYTVQSPFSLLIDLEAFLSSLHGFHFLAELTSCPCEMTISLNKPRLPNPSSSQKSAKWVSAKHVAISAALKF